MYIHVICTYKYNLITYYISLLSFLRMGHVIPGRKIQFLLKKLNTNNSKGYTLLHDGQQFTIHKQTVPKGHFPVYVGEELKRYVIPVAYLSSRRIQDLLNKFNSIVLPCSIDVFEAVLILVEA